jgi:Fic family protein
MEVGKGDALSTILEKRIDATPGGRYRHWQKLRFLQPPPGLSHEQWWIGVKLARNALLKDLPIVDGSGQPFRFAMVDPVMEKLHGIDRDATGEIRISEEVTNPATRDRYIVSQLIDEAITSSQLEGAATTHQVAEAMLRTGRTPRSRDEQMIVNNFLAMRRIRDLREEQLSPQLVMEVHRIVTDGTLERATDVGRLRDDADQVMVRDGSDGEILHVPPPAAQLADRLAAMCAFANGDSPAYFIHPVVRSILLHFWLAYDHPFVDGNGRTARALFYWSMLRQRYWLAEFLSISRVVRKAPGKYKRAYLYSETDENDITYFVLYHLDVLRSAITALHEFLRTKMQELRETQGLLRRSAGLNHRQIALLGHALRNPTADYTIESHRRSHEVVYQTARADLLGLARKGFLRKRKVGRSFVFAPPEDLGKRLRR